MQEESEKQIEDLFKNIEHNLAHKPVRKNLESEVNKDLKKIRSILNKDPISESSKKTFTVLEFLWRHANSQ